MNPLSSDTLATLPEAVPGPAYDRSAITVGIVHLGVGGFHRAHEAMYVDRLMAAGRASDWGICGVGVRGHDVLMRDVLQAQDGLYTLTVKHPDGATESQVIGSIVAYLLAPDDPEAVLELLAAPTTRIVSLTVTEGGYNLDPVSGEFDATNAAVTKDLTGAEPPATVFGLVVEALARRRERGVPPFTVLSCDNIQGNGDESRRAFGAYARLRDAELGDWVEREVSFPNSMVDRITPATTDDDRAAVAALGVSDGWPVVCEPYTQWVLEDNFGQGRPPFEEVGVQLVEDVRPYETMKLRLLNAGHQALGYLGVLLGHTYVHEAAQDPDLAAFFRAYLDREATPTLAPVPGIDLDAYKASLQERFGNAHVRDSLARVCFDGSSRVPGFVLPVVRERLARGEDVSLAALLVAAWARYAEGVDDQGRAFDVVDPFRDTLVAAAARQREDVLAYLRIEQLFGDLATQPAFAEPFAAALTSLHDEGARATLRRTLSALG